MLLTSHGFRVELPEGWEGAVHRLPASQPVLHMATTPLPGGRGDFGSGAVERLGIDDAFVAVVEYGPESLGTALFSTGPLPRRLAPQQFAGNALQRGLPGQAGFQRFCTENGRALCLYVVLGAQRNAARLVGRVNDVLGHLEVER